MSAALRRFVFGKLLLAVCVLAESGCGFQLSRPPQMPFETLYVAAPNYASFGAELKRYLSSTGNVKLVDRPEQAQVTFEVTYEQYETQILALSVQGRVDEFQFRYRVSFSLRDRENHQWIVPTEILLTRDMTYNDETVLAKENEQNLLLQNMRQDAVRQVVRRLARARPPGAGATG